MAITASGYYGLTLERQLIDTAAFSMESETAVAVLMVTDAHTPNFDTHTTYDGSVTNEVSGAGYTAGGVVITTTEVAVGSPAVGQTNYDSANPSWASSTITDAMAAIGYNSTGTSATEYLIWLSDFVTSASTNNGTFTISVHGDGWFYFDHTP